MFEQWFVRVGNDWPSEVDFRAAGIDGIAATIEHGYAGLRDEVMLINLNQAMGEVLSQIGPYISRVRLADLRPEAVRAAFDHRLQMILRYPELDYAPEEIGMIQSYFGDKLNYNQ